MTARNRVRIAAGWCAALLLAAVASGQDSAAVGEMRRWHDRIVKHKGVVSAADGQAAQSKVKAWNLPINDLATEDRACLMRLELHAALAVGDANRAAEWLSELQRADPNTRDTLRAAWLVAGATGDAQSAKRTLEKLSTLGLAGKRAVERRLARLGMIGRAAPDLDLQAQGGRSVSTRHRGGMVLVIDFWSIGRRKPSEKHVKALRDLRDDYAREAAVQFMGINEDEPDKLAEAERFAADQEYDWPQHYEGRFSSAPSPHAAFHVDSTPWDVLIDMHGNVRTVGTAGSPDFQYALRAAVAEARGVYRAILPKTSAGARATAAEQASEAKVNERPEEYVPKSKLPRNAEARRKLDQARLYLKTGRKTDAKRLLREVVDEYPGTYEAREADEWLISL